MEYWMYFKTKAPSAVLKGEEQTLWYSHCGLLILLTLSCGKSMLEFQSCRRHVNEKMKKHAKGNGFLMGREMSRNNRIKACVEQREDWVWDLAKSHPRYLMWSSESLFTSWDVAFRGTMCCQLLLLEQTLDQAVPSFLRSYTNICVFSYFGSSAHLWSGPGCAGTCGPGFRVVLAWIQ